MKADEVAISKSPQQPNTQKILQKKERKGKSIDQFDREPAKDAEREHNDSFEKFYNKDLDLEEGKSFFRLHRASPPNIAAVFRPSPSGDLRTVRISHKLHLPRIIRKRAYPASKSVDNA